MTTLLLTACGGGSGDEGAPPPVDEGDDPRTLYSVGGTVTGLEGDLVLVNNTADSLAVGGVSFEFETRLADGAGYDVAIESHPDTQICTVENASGTIDAADTANVSVLCRAWGTPELIESDETSHADAHDIAVDGNGNAAAVWTRNDGHADLVWSKRYMPSTGWGSAELVGSRDAGSALAPRVVFDDNGNAITVWTDIEGGPVFIALRQGSWANRYTPSSGWGNPVQIEDDPQNAQYPQFGVDGSGNAVFVWGQRNVEGSGWHFREKRYSAGHGWGMPEMIGSLETGVAISDYQMAVDDSGNVSLIWRQYDTAGDSIRAKHYTPGTGWGETELIDTHDRGDNLRIAVNGHGHVIALWDQRGDEGGSTIRASRYTSSGGWTGVELIEPLESGSITGRSLRMAIDDNGNALAVWHHLGHIRAKAYTPATGWGRSEVLETGEAVYLGTPQIAMDRNGNAIALWGRYEETRNNSIWMRRYTVVDGWGMAEAIEIPGEGDARGPRIVFDDTGDAIAVWTQGDGPRSGIWSSRFE